MGTPNKGKIADEYRWAYKDIDQVLGNERDLVRPVMKLKTVAVIKG
jgi:tRNA-splicing ligase RtcB